MIDTPVMRETSNAAASSSRIDHEDEGDCLDVKDPFRRAMPKLDAEADVCSICLDEFTDDDPGIGTCCGHEFHLQCIMQWAQRSRECPLCYKSLGLQDPDMHEMLPFGEYVKPENHSSVAFSEYNGTGDWEVDRLMQRLALQTFTGGHKRTRRHQNRYSESNGQPIAMPSASIAVPQRGKSEASNSSKPEFPGSWPPAYLSQEPKDNGNRQGDLPLRSNVSGDVKPLGESLRSRWTSFQAKCRESFGGRSNSLRQS